MNVALMHFHLRAGGVATVIGHQASVLRKDCDLLLVTGEPPPSETAMPFVHVPGIAYDSMQRETQSPEKVAGEIASAIRRRWPRGCDVLHVHNPLLAKNRQLLDILLHLARSGLPLFLQIHDFAEDGRSAARFSGAYPGDCLYGVLNRRDFHILSRSGWSNDGLALLPNMVAPLSGSPSSNGLVLYPIRAIRRKNIGEALVLSLFLPAGMRLAVSLPPHSPADWPPYRRWHTLARDLNLPVVFDAGLDRKFSELVAEARMMVTTSITEGFGFSFLEPWTAGKPLIGRNLPEITADFSEAGIELDHLYPRLAVPMAWFPGNDPADLWCRVYCRSHREMAVPMTPAAARKAFDALVSDGAIDFGLLNERLQEPVLRRLAAEPAARAELIERNPFLADLPATAPRPDVGEANRERILAAYGAEIYRKRLLAVYARVGQGPVRHRIDKTGLARAFLKPETFSLLKWASHDS